MQAQQARRVHCENFYGAARFLFTFFFDFLNIKAWKLCLTLLGPAAAKRQPSGAPATRSVAARLLIFFEMGHNVRQWKLGNADYRCAAPY